jgi:outer membrane protein assembly factor BamA
MAGTVLAVYGSSMKRLLPNGPVWMLALVLLAGALPATPVLPARASAAPAPVAGPGRRALRLEQIVVSGNERLGQEEILRALDLTPGDTLSVEALEHGRLRLLDTYPVLSGVDLFTRPGSERGAVILEVDVVEKKRVSFETGYGYHDVNGWFLTLGGLRFDQPFRTDSNIRLGFRMGFRLVSLDAEWLKPPPLDGDLGADARFYIQNEDRSFYSPHCTGAEGWEYTGPCARDGSGWSEFRQQIGRAGAEMSLLQRYGGLVFSLGARAESVKPESTFTDPESDKTYEIDDFPEALSADIENTVITGLFLRVTRDTRDQVIYPRSGSVALLSLEANTTILGGDRAFTKMALDGRKLFDLGKDRVFAGRLSAGVTSTGTPYYERFTLGGIYSLRGFKELSLSPAAGFDGYWLAGCELRFPLIPAIGSPPRLTGLVFFDSGMGWQRDGQFSERVEAAAGYGMRLRLPWLGMLGIDVGLPITEGRTGENYRVHGSVGFSF